MHIDKETNELRNLLLDPKPNIDVITHLYEEIISFINSSKCQSLQNTNIIVYIYSILFNM